MIYEGNHHVPEHIDCSEIIQIGGRVKGGIISECELLNNEDIRVAIRSTIIESIEIFTLRNVKPGDYQLILLAIPREKEDSQTPKQG